MGYESKIIIGERAYRKDYSGDTDGHYYVSVIAVFNLSVMGGTMWNRLKDNVPLQENRYFFYDSDGETPILLDRYDTPLQEYNINDLLLALNIDYDEDGYRRLPPFIGMLDMFRTQLEQGTWDKERFVVLHYGY